MSVIEVQKTALVVDDDNDIRELVAFRLERAGLRVIEARNGIEAQQILTDMTPDLAFFDIMMPGLDGYDLTRSVRAEPRLADLPIILLSAKSQEGDIAQGAHVGANGYVMKPFDFPTILNVLRRYLGDDFPLPDHGTGA